LGNITRIGFAGLGMSPNRVPGTALSTWVMNVNQSNAASLGGGYPSAVVVANSSLPADLQAGGTGFPGAASGQALEISLDGAGGAYAAWVDWNSKVMVDPGYVYAVEASVASTAATPAEAPQINLAIATAGFSNATVIQYGPDTATTSTNSMPIAGEGWIKIRAFIEPTAEDLADVATNGGIYPIIIALNKGAAAHANPVKVYVDNVRVYKTVAPDDLQFGGAKVAAIPSRPEVTVGSRQPMYVNPALTNPLAGLPIYGNFENGTGAVQDNSVTTGANANGWVLSGGANPGITASIVATAVPATRIEAGDQNWLEFSFSGTQALGSSIVQTRQMTPSSTSGVLWTPGVYVLSADLQTPTGQTSKPQVYITITDNGFQTFGYSVMRQTTDGAIRRVRVPVTFRDVDIFQILLGGVDPTGASVTGTAHLDNVMLDLIDDRQVYTDQSLFQP
jgi:hypothetical protein